MALEPSVPKIEKVSFDTLRSNLNNLVEDMGSVRHPKRCVKVYARREKKELWVDNKGNIKDGRGTIYVSSKEEVVSLSNDEAKMLGRFKDKWIQFGFLKDKSWYIYDKTDVKISKENDEKNQIEKFGAFGFTKVNDIDVKINERIEPYVLLNLNDYDMLNCTFGYNYSQPAMGFNITISNKRGYNKDLVRSGDLVKIYMWYDRPGDSQFQKLVEDWLNNIDIDKEDEKTNKLLDYTVNFPDNRLDIIKILPKELQAVKEKMGINLMFTGIIDDISYEYSKSSGNKLSFTGRSLGSLLTAARIYKSYPLPNRLRMSHEEVIYDMVSKQTNLAIGTLALSNGDWSKGILGNPKKRKQTFQDWKDSKAGKDLKTITKEEAEESIHERYENEITEMFLTAGKMEEIKDIRGVIKLSDDFINIIFNNNITTVDKSNPKNSGQSYDVSKETNIQIAELKASGFVGPLWIYSDGKVSKDNNGGFPDGTSLKTIVELLSKLNRKEYVELLPEYWPEYGIKIPSDITRADNTRVKPVRLFFATGWGCVKYILQERVIATSAERATKIYAIREFAKAKQSFEDVKNILQNSPDEFRVNYSAIKSDDFSLYEVKDGFDVIRFALSLNIIGSEEIVSGILDEKEYKEYSEDPDSAEPTNKKKISNRPKKGKTTGDQEIKYLLVEEAIDKNCPTYTDAILRIKLFYQKIKQYTRAFHDMVNQQEARAWYPNTDALKVPVDKAKFKKAAVNFPICKKGEIIVIPKNLTNAPRKWILGVDVTPNESDETNKSNLQNQIKGIWETAYNKDTQKMEETFNSSINSVNAFAQIIASPEKDELDGNRLNWIKPDGSKIQLNKINNWTLVFPKDSINGSTPTNGWKIEIVVNEDVALMKELKLDNKDIIFEGETIDEAIKKITSKHLDIVHYVDEFGMFHVRPRFAYKLAGQRREYLLETGGTFFPKYISGSINENTSQIINQVIVMGVSPGNSEFMVVTVDDKESIAKYGIKRDFQKISKIDDVIEAVKRAKSALISNRMKIREVEINCEPMFDLRPGHIVHVNDAASSMGGSFIVDTIGINYSKNGGAIQVIKAFTFGSNLLDTSQLEGQVAYYSKEPGKDSLKEQRQLTESELKDGVDKATKSISKGI